MYHLPMYHMWQLKKKKRKVDETRGDPLAHLWTQSISGKVTNLQDISTN